MAINITILEWFVNRQISHMVMVELFIQMERGSIKIIYGSMMDNSIKENTMDIIDISHKMVNMIIMNFQMVHF